MANITRRRTGEFLREVVKLLWDKPEGLSVKEILDHLANTIKLTEYERGYYETDTNNPRYTKIVRFGTLALVKAGWMTKTKGRWTITELGKEAYKRFPDPEDFNKEAGRLYNVWKKNLPKTEALEKFEDVSEKQTLAFEEAEENAWNQIKDYLLSMNPFDFQKLVGDLLTAMDYHVVWNAPPGKDKGIDIIAYRDPLGTTVPRIKVQVKRHRDQATTVEGLRAFLSTLGIDDVGIFVSSGGFTSDAREEARTQERRKITLLDLEQFYDLWVQYYEKLPQDARQRFPLKPIYYLDLDE